MASFANNAITDVGRILLADVQAGAVFTPTRIVMGSGSMPSGMTIQAMTAVITPVKTLEINKKTRTPDGKCIFGGVYTNKEVTSAFYFRELALYAKAVYLNTDGSVKSEGQEILYSYGNAGATADYMPAYSTSTVVEKQMDLVTWVGNDAKVNLTVESGVYTSRKAFDTHAARHAVGGEDPITPASIGAAPDGFGLGSHPQKIVSLAELDSVFNTGWYRLDQPGTTLNGVSFNYANVLVYGVAPTSCMQELRPWDTNIILRRYCHLNVWGAWEIENPPLEQGKEYRTTERRLGKAVYRKLDTDGVLKYRIDGESAWKTANPGADAVKTYQVYSDEDIDAAMLDAFALTANASLCHFIIFSNGADFMIGGGVWHMTVYRRDSLYGTFELTSYDTTTTRKMMRSLYEGLLQPVAWVNPPMLINVEYRTTERYLGVAVYKKVDNSGNILWRPENDTKWRILAAANNVAPASVQ